MKSIFLKLVVGTSIKLGVAYTLKIIVLSIAGLRGVLNDGNLTDDARKSITAIVNVLIVIRDFVSRMGDLMGAPSLPPMAADADYLNKLARDLNKITDGL
jgi:hypothetical protein